MAIAAPLPDAKDLPNFGWLESWLARGAEPTPPGFRWLSDHGFTTVVNLRAEDDTELCLDDNLHLTHVRFPIADNAPPTLEQAEQWLALCADAQKRPVFVHCQSGHGRTSTFCILVRLAQGWKLDAAIDEEVKRYGFKPKHDPVQTDFLIGFDKLVSAGSIKLPAL